MLFELAILIGVPLATAFILLKPKTTDQKMAQAIKDTEELLERIRNKDEN